MKVLLYGFLTAGVVTAAIVYFNSNSDEQPVTEPTWFGYGDPKEETDISVRKFTIQVSDTTLKDLKNRIRNSRWGEGFMQDFSYGMRVDTMKEIAKYWLEEYDWRKHEAVLNSFSHYETKIEGIDVHFIHAKPKENTKVIHPILVVHGWGGSIWDFYKLIPLLTQPDEEGVAFEVICPSIPGHGFSEAPHQPGFSALSAARIFNVLMRRVGHKRYYTQGGDWGSIITTIMAQQYPQNILGIHLNVFSPGFMNNMANTHQFIVSIFPSLFLSEEERKRFVPTTDMFGILMRESGYFHLQATKPDTIGIGLNDSPVGLAAYILEKFSFWTNKAYVDLTDGGLTKKFTLDELLTNIMIYWTTGTIGSSVRFYKEFIQSPGVWRLDSKPVTVPSGLANFPEEFGNPPKAIAAYKFKNIVQYNYMPRGGHFAAFEEPELMEKDIRSFVKIVAK